MAKFMKNKINIVENIQLIHKDKIYANPNQPRKSFDDENLEELSTSINEHGLIQPITVVQRDDGYMIVAGERRFRALVQLGKEDIPVIVREYGDIQIDALALVENIQREDLNVVEESLAMKNLLELENISQKTLAKRLGKTQSTIANKLRLLKLDNRVLTLLFDGKLNERQGRALLRLDNDMQFEFANRAIENNWNVKELEKSI